jgi:hypothetical protein
MLQTLWEYDKFVRPTLRDDMPASEKTISELADTTEIVSSVEESEAPPEIESEKMLSLCVNQVHLCC